MKRLFIAFLLALLFVWLLFEAATHGWLGLSLKNEIRPLEAISLAVNLLIAFFLQRFVATRMNDLRAEKNVLIEATTSLIRLLNEVREKTEAQLQKDSINSEDATSILSGFRKVANAITDLQDSVCMSQIRSVLDSVILIQRDFFALKGISTGGEFPTKGYSIKQGNSLERLFRSQITSCRRLIFKINSARN